MRPKTYPKDLLDQAADVLKACKQIDPDLQAAGMTQTAFADTLTQTHAIQSQIKEMEIQLTSLRNQRDDQLRRVWETTKRWRAIVKGAYGDDSSEYDLVGGTRMSDRKRPTRRPPELS
jgi:hypothetical protein